MPADAALEMPRAGPRAVQPVENGQTAGIPHTPLQSTTLPCQSASLGAKILEHVKMKRTVLFVIPFLLVGCQSNPNDVSFDAITGNLTPELQTLTERPSDVHRNIAVSNNQDLRMFSEDFGRLWLTDGPSMLSPYPIINSSGNPE